LRLFLAVLVALAVAGYLYAVSLSLAAMPAGL
jgi:hypothetical protein